MSTLTSLLPPEGPTSWLLPLVMIGVGFVEGAIVGAFQARVLAVSRTRWVVATGSAFAGLWAIGALLSTFEPDEPRRATLLAFAALSGALLGCLLTLAQRRVKKLPEQLPRNALGWALAMLLTAIGADFVPYGPLGAQGLSAHALSGLLAGAAAGAVTWGSVRRLAR